MESLPIEAVADLDNIQSDFYTVNDILDKDGKRHESMFSTQSAAFHAQQKQPMLKLYSMTSLLNLEVLLDETINKLMVRLDEEFINGPRGSKACHLSNWILYCES
jgi:hypothetical protein